MKKPKSKGVERVKTDKSIKADHKGQNIIQTVKVTVQAPKQEAKKVKRKRKTSAGSSVTGSKKEAIAELQSNMERFKSLKEQAQKMGIKLPASIGESKYSIDNVKSIADIKGLTQEIMLKNSQIEALIKGSSGAVASSAQLPQQPSSFAPQIVERSQAPPPQPSGRVPSPPQAPQAQSDKDIEAALKAQEAENAKKATAPGELNVEIDALKKNATVPGELNVEIDALDKNAGKTTIGAEGREETLAKMAADKEAEDVREQEERLKMNKEDDLKFQLTREKANQTMTDEELKTDLTGDVNVTIADVGLETGPKVVKDAVDKLESIEIDTQIDNQNILELLRVISVEANDAQKATPIQPEIVKKINRAYRSETMKDYAGSLNVYGDVSKVVTEVEDFIANEDQVQDAQPNQGDDLYEDLVGAKESSDSQIAKQLGLPEIPKEQVMPTLTDKIEGVDASKRGNAETLMKELRLIIDKGPPEELQGVEISKDVQTSLKMAYKTLLGEDYNGPALTTYSSVDENVLKPYQNALEKAKKEQTLREEAEAQAKQDKLNKELAEREEPVFHTHISGGRGMKPAQFENLENELQKIVESKSIPINELVGLNLQEISVVDGKANYADFQKIMSKRDVFKGDPVKYLSVLLIMSQGDGSQFTYTSEDYKTKIVSNELLTEVKRRLNEAAKPLKIDYVGWNKIKGKRYESYGDLVNKTNDIFKQIKTKLGEIYKQYPRVRP